jgi:hypothetical protein
MHLIKFSCADKTPEECHKEVLLTYPNMVSMVHSPNNHMIIEKEDYDNKGHVKKEKYTKEIKDKVDLTARLEFEKIEKEFE